MLDWIVRRARVIVFILVLIAVIIIALGARVMGLPPLF